MMVFLLFAKNLFVHKELQVKLVGFSFKQRLQLFPWFFIQQIRFISRLISD